jgi:beta-lactamase class A
MLLALVLLLSACTAAAAPAPTTAPTSAPTATAAPTAPPPSPAVAPSATPAPAIARNVFVAGVAVGGMQPDAARTALERSLAPLLRPLDIRAGEQALTLRPEDIGFEVGLDRMIDAALAAKPGAKLPLDISYDEAKLRAALEGIAGEAGTAEWSVIKGSEPISRSFVLAGGGTIDVDAALAQVDERLRSVGGARRITLAPSGATSRPPPEQLQAQLAAMAKEWKGVAGIYVYDLAAQQEIAAVNKNTVYAAASTIKVAIMLNAYINLPEFTKRQEQALEKMIVESDNLEANYLLAAAIGGGGTEDAIKGAEAMSAMLADLGLENTYQYVPYEAGEYIRLNKLKVKSGPKDPVGPAPHTESGRWLRTTPAEMAQLYVWIEQCSRGEGMLLEKFDTLDAERCKAMIARLEKNGDTERMVAGLPPGTVVAHKSGWIDITQADVGIVRSPGGDYVAAIYLYRPIDGPQPPIPDRILMSSIANISRLIYSYYNPVVAP